jgi:hypothetical protein
MYYSKVLNTLHHDFNAVYSHLQQDFIQKIYSFVNYFLPEDVPYGPKTCRRNYYEITKVTNERICNFL